MQASQNKLIPIEPTTTIIDPTNLTREHAELLHQFLKADEQKGKKATKVFYQHRPYEFNGSFIRFTHQLTRRTKRRESKEDSKTYHYNVVNLKNLIGVGSFGKIYQVSGKLTHVNKLMIYAKRPGWYDFRLLSESTFETVEPKKDIMYLKAIGNGIAYKVKTPKGNIVQGVIANLGLDPDLIENLKNIDGLVELGNLDKRRKLLELNLRINRLKGQILKFTSDVGHTEKYIPEKQQAMKAQSSKEKAAAINHKLENKLMMEVPYLKVKKITFEKLQEKESYMVMREFGGIELTDVLANKHLLTVKQRYLLTFNLLKALENIQKLGIIHRDIKPGNIKVDPETMEVFIFDFGLARMTNEKDNLSCGTPEWAAPEIMAAPKSANEKSDNYSMGLILKELWDDNLRAEELISTRDWISLRKYEFNKKAKKAIQFSPEIKQALADSQIDAGKGEQKIGALLRGLTDSNPMTRWSVHNGLKFLSPSIKFLFPNIFPSEAPLRREPLAKEPLSPQVIERMKKILTDISTEHLKRYDPIKCTYVTNAIQLVQKLIKNNQGTEKDKKRILDSFKVFMVCCFQNKKGNEFFRNIYTKSGWHIEKELRKMDFEPKNKDSNIQTDDLRAMLFGEYYRNVSPNYSDMVNVIYGQQTKKYLDGGSGNFTKESCEIEGEDGQKKEVDFILTPFGEVDVLMTARELIKQAQPFNATIPLTVERLCNQERFDDYYSIVKDIPLLPKDEQTGPDTVSNKPSFS